MKKITSLILVILIFVCCAGDKASPRGVADQFLALVSKGEYDKAKEFGTGQTAMFLDFSAKMAGPYMDKTFHYKILRDSIVDDHAWVFFYDERTKKEESMDLIKVNDKWKVDLRMKK